MTASSVALRHRVAGTLGSRHLPLLRALMRRELRGRYKGSLLGLAWTFVAPLTLVVAYSAVFHYVFRVVGIDDYPLFLLSGMVAWLFFAAGAQGAAESITGNANLVRKVRFPRQLIPMSAVAGHGATVLAMLALVVPVNLIVVPESRSPALLALPLCLGLLAVMTYGFGLALAVLNVYFRDVQHILAALLLPWFFLTPVFYTPDALPPGTEELRWLTVALEWGNFVAPYVIIVRDTLFSGDWPSPAHLAYCVAVSALFLAGGTWLFRRLQGEMAVEL